MSYPHPVIYHSLLAMTSTPRTWLIYIKDTPERQVNLVVAVPNYDDEPFSAPPECAPVKEVMKEGDRVYIYNAMNKPPGIVSLCEVIAPFTATKPHPAYPEEYPTSWQRPLRILARFEDKPISRPVLAKVARDNGWTDTPLNIKGHFKQGAVYCHEMPTNVAETLASLIQCAPRRIASPYRTVLEALKG